MEYLDPSEPIIKLMKEKLIGKVLKYPKDGPMLNEAENYRLIKFTSDFNEEHLDAFITN